jgi:ankyrin repeat protein
MPRLRRSKKKLTRPAHRRSVDTRLVREWLFAAERGDVPATKRLLSAEPRLLDASGQGPYWEGKFRALHYAVARGHQKMIRWLLSRGASATAVAGDADWAPIHFAAMPAKPRLVRLLIDHGAQMDVFAAAAMGDVRVVRRMLRGNPNLIASRGPDGGTPLHFSGSPKVARVLLAAGADTDVRDRFHRQTPAEWAVDNPKVVAVLAEAGADVDLHLACALGDLKSVRTFIRRDPKKVNAEVSGKKRLFGANGETPLGIAARYGQRKIVDLLLARGATATRHPSPLPDAVRRGDRAIVKRLLEAGADPNAFGPHGYAALHAATMSGNLAMIRLLMSKGARLDLKDEEHHSTPLGWAAYFHQKRAVAYLRAQSRT